METKSEFVGSNRSVVVTLLLWFFFGTFGVYRMYLGKVGTGILMLVLTIIGFITIPIIIGILILIGLFIWWIIDLVSILKSPKINKMP
ncbi:TM2 domain-containing protein [Gilliamella sp. B2776]|uniref:TM2 domain-containing protein n=1 Tax=unclassified Gilliamella TaxID=2685620 RepID=UPI002269E2C5|nr:MULTISPECIES: TM2 domain-containing protein [unclassified Gilliamella]MCX8650127.1 TM2 domain-containing protein [Gilliamella sp. B2779]MCX8653526.1 TM2 domain-containing protein [Gilliamella sp. B2737]MCX8656380.1 TM2 domain-containing protein [Gilliamella sp. B2894]MCX8665222.1 TM2 domain-containing protein [Gilliamella sp. B2887]MCX8692002.1 TM2 domain-containing protein [Gilliamella sp. B2776]